MEPIVRHRRPGGPITTGRVIAVLCVFMVVAGGAVAYLKLRTPSCTGPLVTLNVAASPDHASVLTRLAQQWNDEDPVVDGHCVEVAVRSVAPAAVAAALSPTWDPARDGVRPDVWAPDASSWLLVVGARPEAAGLLPVEQAPSLASSPVVLAMQRPMAEALGWPNKEIDWAELVTSFAGGQTWERFGHPEWGGFKMGVVDPTQSAAGLAGVLGVLDPDNDNTMSSQELFGGVAFSQLVTAFAPDTETLFDTFRQGKPDLPTAFPALERDLAAFAVAGPKVPLVPVYPKQGAAYADYPFVVLRAPWVDAVRTRIAADFLAHLRTETGRVTYAEAGFRDPAHAIGPGNMLRPELGFRAAMTTTQRKPNAEALGQLLGMWTVLQRENNVLLALDTSGSMKELVPGANATRLQMLQKAAIEGISLLTNNTRIGLWEFSSEYRELVPIGVASEQIGGVTRRQAMIGAVSQLKAAGGTALYDTVLAAYTAAQQSWRPNAQNLMVVITDGKNEDPDGITLEQLTAALKTIVRADRPLWVLAIAVGPQADAAALDTITKVTGGSTFVARDDVSAIQQIVLAFAGRLS